MKLLNIITGISILFALFSTLSCTKKEEEVQIDPCHNGEKDATEEEIDCGGTCEECIKYPYLILTSNGEAKQATSKFIEQQNSNYYLNGTYDTINFRLNLGSNINIGNFNISSLGSILIANQSVFNLVEGFAVITQNELTNKKLGGNFEASFASGQDTI